MEKPEIYTAMAIMKDAADTLKKYLNKYAKARNDEKKSQYQIEISKLKNQLEGMYLITATVMGSEMNDATLVEWLKSDSRATADSAMQWMQQNNLQEL